MLKFAPYVLKNMWRHRTRTALTICGAAVALVVFIFIGALQDGLAGLTRGPNTERTLIVFQANRFCPSTSRLPEDYAGVIGKMEGVRDVTPVKVFMNNCRASLDVIVFNGLPAAKLRGVRDLTLIAGDWHEFEQRRDAAVVGQAVARRRGLSVGQRFSVGEVTVTVVGIYTAPEPAEENFLYTDLEFLQRTRGLNSAGTVTQLEVRLKEGADAQRIGREIDAAFRNGPIATDTRPKGVFQTRAVGDLAELINVARFVGYVCLAMVLALVATAAVMAVQDRVRETAVLQTIGFSGPLIFRLVLAESLIVSLAGGILGVGLALAVLAWSHLTVGTEGVMVTIGPSLQVGVTGLCVTAVVGVLAGIVPGWQASRASIVTSLRYV